MIKIWQFLIHGCWHDWHLLGRGALMHKNARVGEYYQYKCSKCERIEDRMPL